MTPLLASTGQPPPTGQALPQPKESAYIVVQNYTYRAVVGVFGAGAKLAANLSSVASQAASKGFSNVQVWATPQDQGFPTDWASPATAASIRTSDDIFYVEGTFTGPTTGNSAWGPSATLPAYSSTLLDTQGGEVWEVFVRTCQGIGTVQNPSPVVKATPAGFNWGAAAGWTIAAVSVIGLGWEIWKHTHRKKVT